MDREALWLRVETLVVDLIEERGESRNSLGPKLGLGRNQVGRYLRTAEERQHGQPVRSAFDLAFQVAEYLGISPTSLLAPFATDAPEVLLEILPCEPDKKLDVEMLWAIGLLEERIFCEAAAISAPWPERRFGATELASVYSDLEDLEERRHYEADAVAAQCRDVLTEVALAQREPTGLVESVRLVGLAGIWGTIQRCRNRLREARGALRHSLALARRLDDQSLYANQLQRAAYAFRELGAPNLAVAVLREASERYHSDNNRAGAAHTLVDRAVMAFHRAETSYAERLYQVGLDLIPADGSAVYRAWATQGLATCRDLQGDVKGALMHLDAAVTEAEPRNECLRASLLFTAANLERRIGRFAEAEAKYTEAVRIFSDRNDADAVLRICLDLSVCLVQGKRHAKLADVKRLIQAQLPKLRNRRSLQHQYELLLRELSNESVGLGELARVAKRGGSARR